MGTRNLTIVKIDGKTKVAQYGQWDGYPMGQGLTIAEFLESVNLPKFKKQVRALKKWSEPALQKAWIEAGAKPEDEYVSSEISNRFHAKHPGLSRDHGAEILYLIHRGEVKKVKLMESFKEDTLFCEYYYEIDLDEETVSVNGRKKYKFGEWTKALMKRLK